LDSAKLITNTIESYELVSSTIEDDKSIAEEKGPTCLTEPLHGNTASGVTDRIASGELEQIESARSVVENGNNATCTNGHRRQQRGIAVKANATNFR
jgi:hypothetical protein